MVVDLKEYLSHPDKLLLTHINNVRKETNKRTNSYIADYSAIFHDLGKLNPNFQRKLRGEKVKSYSNHSYLSALFFLAYCNKNSSDLKKHFNDDTILAVTAIMSIISSHHKNLPNLSNILNNKEVNKLVKFILNLKSDIPVQYFLNCNIGITKEIDYKIFANIEIIKKSFLNFAATTLKLVKKENYSILDYYFDILFSFSSLIISDKIDAGNYYILNNNENFFNNYNINLIKYIKKFKNDSELNNLRSKIRLSAKLSIKKEIKNGKRFFSLTSPTGSGKTVLLLSLAGEILKQKGNYRIIYTLPFLSITEQVEKICCDIFKDNLDCVKRIDSKSENILFEEIQKKLDDDPDFQKKILNIDFNEDSFNFPFIITTFVRFFETFLSNKNKTLLKLSNLSKSIFLVDEIQSLPPRLYSLFVALLYLFCEKYDSYAIISSATMPNFELPENNKHDLKKFFEIKRNNYKINYSKPIELVNSDIFSNKIFNRYYIKDIGEINLDELAELIDKENESVLIVLNTIEDTKILFKKIKSEYKILLNTNFTVRDRLLKIELTKRIIKNKKKKLVLISTQLIEAGVDIDFPIVYRDFAPLPNIVQSAGRCNRNGKFNCKGKVILFKLIRNGTLRANLIYNGEDKKLLDFTLNSLDTNTLSEIDTCKVQNSYFFLLKDNLLFGKHNNIDIIECIENLRFEDLGKFNLINREIYGKEYSYYIPQNSLDNKYEILEKLANELMRIDYNDFNKRKFQFLKIESLLRNMSNQIVRILLKRNDILPNAEKGPCFNLYKLSEGYNSKQGITLNNDNLII